MTPRDQWAETLARLRYERDTYAKRAADQRRQAQRLRERRDWLGALVADDRAGEYRRERDRYATEADKIRKQWGLK